MRTKHIIWSMSRSPIRPTLFPYTTLFRSKTQQVHEVRRRAVHGAAFFALTQIRAAKEFCVIGNVVSQHRHRLDRKSTRLNSSHSQISYAVFCLKKKTI